MTWGGNPAVQNHYKAGRLVQEVRVNEIEGVCACGYGYFDGNGITLTTENGSTNDPSNRIYLEMEVLFNLCKFGTEEPEESDASAEPTPAIEEPKKERSAISEYVRISGARAD